MPVLAQSEEPTPDGQASPSQETDINEDNYRRFMELKDQSRQRPSQPYAALAPPGNLEKMEKLPEDSQKHLRNQLRSIIVERGRWTPADAESSYPFVPSEAAAGDARLGAMETEAWAELIENYHAREAEIYGAAARARGTEAGVEGGPGGQAGNAVADGQQHAGPGALGRQDAAQPNASGQGASGTMPGGAARQTGVSQNAMEYLSRLGQTGTESEAGSVSPSGEADSALPNASGQGASGTLPGGAARQTGVSQNAMEYLSRLGQTGTESEAGSVSPSGEADSVGTDDGDDTPKSASAASAAPASPAGANPPSPGAPAAVGEPTAEASSAATASNNAAAASADEPAARSAEVIYRSQGVIAIRDLIKLDDQAAPAEETAASGDEERDEDG